MGAADVTGVGDEAAAGGVPAPAAVPVTDACCKRLALTPQCFDSFMCDVNDANESKLSLHQTHLSTSLAVSAPLLNLQFNSSHLGLIQFYDQPLELNLINELN